MKTTLIWLEKDLRLQDNPAIEGALDNGSKVVLTYIYDTNPQMWPIGGASKWWLHHSLTSLMQDCKSRGFTFILRKGDPEGELLKLSQETHATRVFWNRRYEPYSIQRDQKIQSRLEVDGVEVKTFKGSLLFDPWEVTTRTGSYYRVFKPFHDACLKMVEADSVFKLKEGMIPPSGLNTKSDKLESLNLLPTHPNWAVEISNFWTPGEKQASRHLDLFIEKHLVNYPLAHNRPDLSETSFLSPYLAFGEISPKQVWNRVMKHYSKETKVCVDHFLRQIIWREYCYHLLFYVSEFSHISYQRKFEDFPWDQNANFLHAWQKGQTGYPLIDAGMRQLWHIGWMHNRVRMVVASFLTKDLLIHWKEGASWFWDTLVDADLANNSFNWQWCSGTGIDPAPYFRIFNPVLQGEKFDPEGGYVSKWVPELSRLPKKWIHKPWMAPASILKEAGVNLGLTYPYPIVEHKKAREYALKAYKDIRVKKEV